MAASDDRGESECRDRRRDSAHAVAAPGGPLAQRLGWVPAGAFGIQFAHRISFHADAVGAVHDAVTDRIGDGGSPITSCHDDTGSRDTISVEGARVAIFEDLQQCQPRQGVQRLQRLQRKIID